MNAPLIVSADLPGALADAARRLRTGGLVAFPTETVYGLGADATSDRAVAAVFAAKGRPDFNPLIVHVARNQAIDALVTVPDRAARLIERFWPGPLTLVLPRRADSPVSLLATAGLDTVAVRRPDHPVALALIEAAGCPVAAPSANASGRISPTCAAHVAESLGTRAGLILDGGPCRVGVESTVLDMSGPRPVLLRPGAVTLEELTEILGEAPRSPDDGAALRSPGLLISHYAPKALLRMGACSAGEDEVLLGFGPGGGAARLNLSPTGDVTEAAANLFAMLRALDETDARRIAVMPIPESGLGRAINDRLRRAAAPRGTP